MFCAKFDIYATFTNNAVAVKSAFLSGVAHTAKKYCHQFRKLKIILGIGSGVYIVWIKTSILNIAISNAY
jgi:hypothetical protein